MKAISKLTGAAMIGTATTAFAASGAESDGMGMMTILFLGFGALIILFQMFPGFILFYSMLKGLLTIQESTVVDAKGKNT